MPSRRLATLLLGLGALVIYLPVKSHGFLFDDADYITTNEAVQGGVSWEALRWAFTKFHSSNWHPVTWLSHLVDCQLFGLNPAGPHIVNMGLHAANTALLFTLLIRLTGSFWPSVFVAAFFAAHPLRVESVAWIAERKDVLSGLFMLLTLHAYAGRRMFAAAGMFALALMSKPMAVTLPFVMLLLDYWPLGRFSTTRTRELIVEKWGFFLLAASSCALTVLAQGHGKAIVPLELHSFAARLENAPAAYASYLLKSFWPVDLAVYYPLPERISGGAVAGSVAALGILSALVWAVRKRAPYALVGWLWFLGMLVPVIGLVQVGSQAFADRYMYFPQIGLLIAVVFGAQELAKRARFPQVAFNAAGCVVAGALTLVTEKQLSYWENGETLFTHALAVTADNAISRLNLGIAYQEEGKLNAAAAEYEKVAQRWPEMVFAHYALGGLLSEMGRPQEASSELQRAVEARPSSAAIRVRVGVILVQLRRYEDAYAAFRAAARLDPNDAWPHFEMGKALALQGRDAEAAGEFREAVALRPNDAQILQYAAQLLAASEEPGARDGQMALAWALRANELTGGANPAALDTLAMALAETGRFEEARQIEQRAIDVSTGAGATNVDVLRERLKLYGGRSPWRQRFGGPVRTGQ